MNPLTLWYFPKNSLLSRPGLCPHTRLPEGSLLEDYSPHYYSSRRILQITCKTGGRSYL